MVSIIVPSYNCAHLIAETIDSVINQTYKDFELIIIDDGSTDNTQEILSNYSDSRIRIIKDENHGVSYARNHGLDEAKGEYITFTDADDILEPTYLESLVNAIQNADYARCNYSKMENYKLTPDSILLQLPNETTGLDILKKTLTSIENLQGYVWSSLFKKDVIEEHHIRFHSNISFGEDLVFTCQYLQYVDKAHIVHESLYNYRINAGSISNKYGKKMQSSLDSTNQELQKIVNAINNPDLNEGLIRVIANTVLICFYNNRNTGNPFTIKTRKEELEKLTKRKEYYEAIKFEIKKPLKGKYWLIRTVHYILILLFYKHA